MLTAMRVLVTGGAGFIGSHLTEALLGEGHHVTVLDDLSTGRLENLHGVHNHGRLEVAVGSVTDVGLVQKLVDNAEVVYHLAAAVGVRRILEQNRVRHVEAPGCDRDSIWVAPPTAHGMWLEFHRRPASR